MPAEDLYHPAVRTALEKEQWTITAEHLSVRFLGIQLWIDLAADRVIAAERGQEKIAVEVKSFLNTSVLSEFHAALGQYLNYRAGLASQDPERVLYLAVPEDVYRSFFQAPFGQFAIAQYQLKLLVYHVKRQEIIEWLH